jgi:hypothetical protein
MFCVTGPSGFLTGSEFSAFSTTPLTTSFGSSSPLAISVSDLLNRIRNASVRKYNFRMSKAEYIVSQRVRLTRFVDGPNLPAGTEGAVDSVASDQVRGAVPADPRL